MTLRSRQICPRQYVELNSSIGECMEWILLLPISDEQKSEGCDYLLDSLDIIGNLALIPDSSISNMPPSKDLFIARKRHAKTTAPEPAPVKGTAPEPAPLKGTAPEPAPLKGDAPEPAPLKGDAPEPAPVTEASEELDHASVAGREPNHAKIRKAKLTRRMKSQKKFRRRKESLKAKNEKENAEKETRRKTKREEMARERALGEEAALKTSVGKFDIREPRIPNPMFSRMLAGRWENLAEKAMVIAAGAWEELGKTVGGLQDLTGEVQEETVSRVTILEMTAAEWSEKGKKALEYSAAASAVVDSVPISMPFYLPGSLNLIRQKYEVCPGNNLMLQLQGLDEQLCSQQWEAERRRMDDKLADQMLEEERLISSSWMELTGAILTRMALETEDTCQVNPEMEFRREPTHEMTIPRGTALGNAIREKVAGKRAAVKTEIMEKEELLKSRSQEKCLEKAGGKKTGRGQGGQPGRLGKTHKREPLADEIVDIEFPCPADYEGNPEWLELKPIIRQSQDIIPVVWTTDYRIKRYKNRISRKIIHAKAPPGVNANFQFGPRLRTEAVLLRVRQHLPFDRIAEHMRDSYSISISPSTVCNIVADACQSWVLEDFDRAAVNELRNSKQAHFDESGDDVFGNLFFVHVALNDNVTRLFLHPKRGREAMNDGEILQLFKGVGVTDSLSSYNIYEFIHALCGSHILRELASSEAFGYDWARKMRLFLVRLVRLVNKNGGLLSPSGQLSARTEYRKIIGEAYAETIPREKKRKGNKPKKGRTAKSKTLNLLIRLDDRMDDTLRFTTDKDVPFTNNAAERAIRWVKLHLKISGCYRSLESGQGYCRLMGYVMTCRKNGIGAYDAIERLMRRETPLFIREWLENNSVKSVLQAA
jgi:transposase